MTNETYDRIMHELLSIMESVSEITKAIGHELSEQIGDIADKRTETGSESLFSVMEDVRPSQSPFDETEAFTDDSASLFDNPSTEPPTNDDMDDGTNDGTDNETDSLGWGSMRGRIDDAAIVGGFVRLFGEDADPALLDEYRESYRKYWDVMDEGELLLSIDNGVDIDDIARSLRRSRKSVTKKAWKLGYGVDGLRNVFVKR